MNSIPEASFRGCLLPGAGRLPFIARLLWLVLLLLAAPRAKAQDTVCARVKIEIKQELTLERQAFDAQMKINNTTDTGVIENVSVAVKVADEDGTPVAVTGDPNDLAAKFFIRVSSKDNIATVDGTGTVAPKTTATVDWLLIPAPGSAGSSPLGKKYLVGATLTYTFGGEQTVLDVSPDVITVKPLPLLALDYFLPADVWADDPLTPAIEPPEPFTLGVRVKNTGLADAKNLKIDSAQPKIVENNQGLLINFILTGSYVDDAPVQNTLLVDFGDLAAGTSKMGRWNMETTLAGKFTAFTARFSHSDELGGALTSILQAATAHTLIHDVRVDLPGRDAVHDFLALDGGAVRVYESDSLDSDVADRSSKASLTAGTTVSGNPHFNLSFPATDGFVYVKLPDPYGGQKVFGRVVRSDAKVLAAENVWLSRTRNEQTKQWQYWVNFFDVNTSGTYDTAFQDPPASAHAPVIQFVPDRTTQETKQVSFIVEASSPDGKPVTLSAAPLPAGAKFTQQAADPQAPGAASALFDWTPARGTFGGYLVVYTASDGSLGATRSAGIKVESAAVAALPPAANNDSGTTRKTVRLTLSVLANDRVDMGASGFDPATLDLDPTTSERDDKHTLAGEGAFTANPDGTVSFEPLPGFSGVSTTAYRVKDNTGHASNTANITVTVTGPANPAGDTTVGQPAANPDAGVTAVDTTAILDVKSNDVASAGETLGLASVDLDTGADGVQASRILPEGTWTSRLDGTVAFTPAAGYGGLASLAYAISDTAHKTAQSAVSFAVVGGTQALALDDSASTLPMKAVVLAVLNNDNPGSGGTLSADKIDLDASTLNPIDAVAVQEEGAWAVNPDGTVGFTPASDYKNSGQPFTGPASLVYAVTDSNGWRATARMTVAVNPVQANGAPKAVDDSAATAFAVPVGLSPYGNDKAAPGAVLDPATIDLNPATDALDWTISTAEGSWQVNDDGTVVFTPSTQFAGTTAARPYRVRDSLGNYADANLSVSVAPPGGLSVSGTVFHDLNQNQVQDGGEPGADGGGLYVTALDNASQPVATIAVNADGSYNLPVAGAAHYTLVLSTAANAVSPALPNLWSFTGENTEGSPVGIADGRLNVEVGVASLAGRNFGILGAAPVAHDDAAMTPHDTRVDLAVLANDTQGAGGTRFDPASVDLDPSTPGIQTQRNAAGEGVYTVDQATGAVTFQPLAGFSGVGTPVNYRVMDNLGRMTNIATMTVVVGPAAVDDNNTTSYNTVLVGSLSANDIAPSGSVYAKLSGPSHGTVTVNADGSYLYAPPGDYSGPDSFTYKLCLPSPYDTVCDSAVATLTIAVPVTPPELQMQMDVSSNQPAVGILFFYRLAVSNSGGPTTGPAHVVDTLPDGARLVKVNVPDAGWACSPAVTQSQPLQGGNGAALTCDHAGSLAAGSQTITLTAVPTAASGSYINQATITGDGQTPQSGACDGSATANCGQATITPKNPRLELIEKVSLLPSDETGAPDGKAQTGEKLTYAFALTNRGDAPLSRLSLGDGKLDAGSLGCAATTAQGRAFSLADPSGILQANDAVVCTGKHTVAADESNAGRVENTATATGRAPDGSPAQSTSTGLWGNAPPQGQPSLVKTAAHHDADGDGAFEQGETVGYRFVVRNVGTASLSNVTVGDPLLPSISCTPTTLAAGAQAICTAPDYVLTHADEAAGQVTNTATAVGMDANGHSFTATDSKVLNSGQSAALALKNSAVLANDQGQAGLTAGDTLAYTLAAVNSGAVALTNVTITDNQFGTALQANGVCLPAQGSTLNPGDSMVCTASYRVQEGEAAPIVNTANATGKPVGRNAPVDTAAQYAVPYVQTAGPVLYALGGRVWLDGNDNGIMEAAETGIDGVVVRLHVGNGTAWEQAKYADGSPVPDQLTVGSGYYQFTRVPQNAPGQNYRLAVLPLNFKSDSNGTKPLYGAVSSYVDDNSAFPWADGRDQGIGTTPSATDGTLGRSFDLGALPFGVTAFNGVDFGFAKKATATAPDLVVSKQASVTTVSPGGSFSYTLTGSNKVGAEDLKTRPTILDTLPVGMTAKLPITATGWNCTASTTQKVSCSYTGSLPVSGGGSLGAAIVVPVTAPASTGVVNNTATITKLAGETSYTDNSATVSVTVGNP